MIKDKKEHKVISTVGAFTLIELLVVISIISLLVSILLPSLNKARDLAREVLCLTNLKQHGIAHPMYLADNNNVYVYCITDGGTDGYAWFLEGFYDYLPLPVESGTSNVYLCPSDASPARYVDISSNGPGGHSDTHPLEYVKYVYSYGVNYCVCLLAAGQPASYWNKMYVTDTEVEQPQRTLITGDCYGYRMMYTNLKYSHSGGESSNFLFADGHSSGYSGDLVDPVTGWCWGELSPLDIRWEPCNNYWNWWLL